MIPPSDTDVPQGKITQAEMIEMFGESMPFEARQLIADAPPDWTLAQMRQRLREIAAERNHRSSDTDVRELVADLRTHAFDDCGGNDIPTHIANIAAAALESQLSHIARLERLLLRYRKETPLGHQPHMIAHEVDEALNRSTDNAG